MNWESYGDHGFFICVRETPGRQSKPCIIHGGNLQHAHSGHSTTHLKIKKLNKWQIKEMLRCSLSACPIIFMWACPCHRAWRYPVGGSRWYAYIYNDKSLAWDSKLSCMRFGYSYSWDTGFLTYDLSSICIIIALTLTLTIQDAYDGGNESSKPVSNIIFEGFKTCNHCFPPRRAYLFTFMLSHHLLSLCTIKRA
jgi:hypothetical protein